MVFIPFAQRVVQRVEHDQSASGHHAQIACHRFGVRVHRPFRAVGNHAKTMAEDADTLIHTYRDHSLKGEWAGFRELHIEGDWLLIYRIDHGELCLVLTRTGSHDALFGRGGKNF